MRIALKGLGILLGIVLLLVALWLFFVPPDLLRVGSGYAAKMVCSNVFLAGRDPDEVLAVDVQAPGHPLLRLMQISVDREAGTVSAGLLGTIATNTAVHRPGLGCATVPEGNVEEARGIHRTRTPLSLPDAPWPKGQAVSVPANPELEAALDDATLTGPGMRAVVVVKDGRIVGERYGEGFSAETPLLGWSMTKTVNAAIIGTLVQEGQLALDQQQLFNEWGGDDRAEIRLSDLMGMSSGLTFNEGYGSVSDVTRMLYLEGDMAGYVASLPLETAVGSEFRYSSGTSVLLSSIWQRAVAERALALPWQALFDPIGMTSAVLEADQSGTFVGSSYLYATSRDWARFGLLLLNKGEWNGRQIFSRDFAAWMREPASASGGSYGRGQLWLQGPGRDGDASDRAAGLPEDAFWVSGHDGQSMVVIPSERMVVVRLGLTPGNQGYVPQPLVAVAVAALAEE